MFGNRPKARRRTPKGRQFEDEALGEIRSLLVNKPRQKDLLIEFLHLIQDKYGYLSAQHLCALAEELKISMAEVYEVASFYAHFDIVKEDETPPPKLTIRVCDSLSCELAGAQRLREELQNGLDPNEVRVLRAPCMGRCDTAPTLEIGHNHIDFASPEKVKAAISEQHFHCNIPEYEGFQDYFSNGGYQKLLDLRLEGDWEDIQNKILDSGLRGSVGQGFLLVKSGGLFV